ncbi:MAG: NADH-quinone oxidoreductase subunit L [Phenylobacterium sp.]|jgi:NADH-quinone oxidoreductase subunit L
MQTNPLLSQLLPLVPLIPLISALLLIFVRPSKAWVSRLGVGSIGLAAAISLTLNIGLWDQTDFVIKAGFGNWMQVSDLSISLNFYLDPLSLVMISIITGVGFLIHLYSTGFMQDDTDYCRYFAYLNLFVASMLILVLADNMLLLYMGWEGVGLCSYLLIGFWYKDRNNNAAANKAFLITRIGDTGMAIGLFLLFYQLGTLDIQLMQSQALAIWQPGNEMATICCLLLLAGAAGKSAQLPLQNWLPDAMAGPTPVSALIHAATMVTAGVYLIARNYQLFHLSPDALYVVALMGTCTLLLAASAAMVQSDVKRILAYSTISQIGYMFLALGVGAGSAAVFHLMTHAFFKALLFLSAGALIYSVHHEHNIFKMGGLLKKLPIVAASFAVGCAALASFPFTSGFFSKESILERMIDGGFTGLWWAAVAGAFITAFYSARLFFVVFLGKMKQAPNHQPSKTMHFALIILIIPSIFAWIEPRGLSAIMPALPSLDLTALQHWLPIFTPIIAITVAWVLFKAQRFGAPLNSHLLQNIHSFLKSGWAFDTLYHHVFVRPFKWLCHSNRHDVIDLFYRGLEVFGRTMHEFATSFQTGRLRTYNASLILFCVLAISWVLIK